MQNPMSWSLPFFRAFGVLVKVHVLYFLFVVGLILRTMTTPGNVITLADAVLVIVPLTFVIILLHEFGHVFGGRAVGGEAEEILMWPLGGLAFVDTPREWQAHSITVASGPLVNVGICLLAAGCLAVGGFVPTLNPLDNLFVSPMHNLRDGRTYSSDYMARLYEPGSKAQPAVQTGKPDDMERFAAANPHLERALAPVWAVWVNRAFFVSYILFLINLIPGYPLDGGQLLQGFVWARTDYRTGIRTACISGYICGCLMMLVSIWLNEVLVIGLAFFMVVSSWLKMQQLTADNQFGYDFSGGYSTLDADADDAPPKPKQEGLISRWMQARKARRLQEEQEQRQKDEERMDQLLDKIATRGKESLTDEERRFMQRVSERYRK